MTRAGHGVIPSRDPRSACRRGPYPQRQCAAAAFGLFITHTHGAAPPRPGTVQAGPGAGVGRTGAAGRSGRRRRRSSAAGDARPPARMRRPSAQRSSEARPRSGGGGGAGRVAPRPSLITSPGVPARLPVLPRPRCGPSLRPAPGWAALSGWEGPGRVGQRGTAQGHEADGTRAPVSPAP